MEIAKMVKQTKKRLSLDHGAGKRNRGFAVLFSN
jgi:hypothetical protein